MSEFNYKNIDILSLSLDGFEGPIDLLLSLARDHKIDLTKLSILKLAEQYLEFLDKIIKKINFTHPYYDQKALDNQKNLKSIQNKENILFCGSYFGYGFHEDGIKSSIEMLKNLND